MTHTSHSPTSINTNVHSSRNLPSYAHRTPSNSINNINSASSSIVPYVVPSSTRSAPSIIDQPHGSNTSSSCSSSPHSLDVNSIVFNNNDYKYNHINNNNNNSDRDNLIDIENNNYITDDDSDDDCSDSDPKFLALFNHPTPNIHRRFRY
jgi:hypothetical protein